MKTKDYNDLHHPRGPRPFLLLLVGTLLVSQTHAQFPGGGFGGNGGGRNGGSSASAVQQAAQQVTVVADEYSNSLLILAPEIYQGAISNLVKQLDIQQQDITELRVFALQNADPTEMAEVLTSLFEDQTSSSSSSGGNRGPGVFFGGGRGGRGGTTSTDSERSKKQSKVVAVPDPRTSSVLVSASKDLMEQIAPMIAQLDNNTSKKQKVFVYSLENAEPTEVETVLKNLFETQTSRNGRTTQSSQQNNALSQRQSNNARTQGSTSSTSGFGSSSGLGGSGGLGGTGR